MPTPETLAEPAVPESQPAGRSKGAMLIAVGAFLLLVLLIVTNMK